MGRLPRRKVSSYIHGAFQGCPRHHFQQRRNEIPECCFRSTDEALGYRDWFVGFHLCPHSPSNLASSTGQCLQAFSNGKIPYCVKFHPEKQNVFLAGMSDKKIIQVGVFYALVALDIQLICAPFPSVRHEFRRNHPRIRPTSGTGQHHQLCRRQSTIHHHF